MVIKVAVPHQFKLKVIPDFRTIIVPGQKRYTLYRRIGDLAVSSGYRSRTTGNS